MRCEPSFPDSRAKGKVVHSSVLCFPYLYLYLAELENYIRHRKP